MRLEALIGWRDCIYPGPVLYDFKGQYAWDGHPLTVAAAPSGAPQPASGTESPFNGRALFYTGQFGGYQYGMNSSSSNPYTMTVNGAGINLANGAAVAADTVMTIGPLSCCVIYIAADA